MENENSNFVPEQPVYNYEQPVAVSAKPPVMLLPVFYIVATFASGIVTALSSGISTLILSYTSLNEGVNVVNQVFGLISAVIFFVLAFVGIKVYNSKCKSLNIPEKSVPVYYIALFYLPDVFSGFIARVLNAIMYAVIAVFSIPAYGTAIMMIVPGIITGIAGIGFAFLIFNWVFKIRDKEKIQRS